MKKRTNTSGYRVGQDLFYVDVATSGRCQMDVWKVRSIRGGFVHVIYYSSFTWGKISKKQGDFGWLNNIPSWCRDKIAIGEDRPRYHRTKLQAWRAVLRSLLAGTEYIDEPGLSSAIRVARRMARQ